MLYGSETWRENEVTILKRAEKSVVRALIDIGQMKQLPRPPLENSTYSFNSLQMFFRGYYEVGTKSGQYKVVSR